MQIVVGVAGGIAAYKACELVRRLRADGHDVRVVPTDNALNFVGRTTWEALSGQPVATTVWEHTDEVAHVRIGQQADLVVVAPATADLLSRAATGRADDLLTNVLLTASCPVVMAPAMHTEMWEHPATRANVATLRERGVVVMDPASGRLTGADSGPGRLPEAADIHHVVAGLVQHPGAAAGAAVQELAGTRWVVSAGGTREHLDPVRFLGNASSGLMGIQIARAAALRGAEVDLVVGQISVDLPSGCTVHHVTTTADLATTMNELAVGADTIVMAAAPADWKPVTVSEGKLKKTGDVNATWEFTQTTDVLAGLAQRRSAGQVIVGFAAETAGDRAALLELGQEKLVRKGCDLLVCNDVSRGAVFGADDNQVVILDTAGPVAEAHGPKSLVAHRIVDAVLATSSRSSTVE